VSGTTEPLAPTAQRMAEFRVLARPAWTEWLLNQGLCIVRYADI